jgi:hypothetical protein
MAVMWIVVGVAIASALAVRIVGARGARSVPDLGCVSGQWLAEHRFSYLSDPQR